MQENIRWVSWPRWSRFGLFKREVKDSPITRTLLRAVPRVRDSLSPTALLKEEDDAHAGYEREHCRVRDGSRGHLLPLGHKETWMVTFNASPPPLTKIEYLFTVFIHSTAGSVLRGAFTTYLHFL
jgi:hypothetical protein